MAKEEVRIKDTFDWEDHEMRFENTSAKSMILLKRRVKDKIKWLSFNGRYSVEVLDVEFHRDTSLVNSYRAIIKYRYK